MKKQNRYTDYQTMAANRYSICRCGREIERGDMMAYNLPARKSLCLGCYQAWGSQLNSELAMSK